MSNEQKEREEIIGKMRRLANRKYQSLSDAVLILKDLQSRLPSGQVESADKGIFQSIEIIHDLSVEAAKTFFLSIDFYFKEFNSIENRKRLDALSDLFIILDQKLDYEYRIIHWMLVVVDQNGPSQISLVRPIYRQLKELSIKIFDFVKKLEELRDSDDFERFLDDFNAQQK
ncbi:hypothetical protein SSS_08646 [Sarcoptes scabiei]|uniref:Uncharacterized protein n=1 Tax=Sarcoptes scabiei TaxID=52283 RepID=A0A132A0R3_SARSC|nr:hypothetical protein SSS_08646 [Sarcoptes scabiei]KPM04399.1 hypothetical protein QR98_0028430 [Sarcoptes scabiei]